MHRPAGRGHLFRRPVFAGPAAQAGDGLVALRVGRAGHDRGGGAGLAQPARAARAAGRGDGRRAGGGHGLSGRRGRTGYAGLRHGPVHQRQRLRRAVRARHHGPGVRPFRVAGGDGHAGLCGRRRRRAVRVAAAGLAPLHAATRPGLGGRGVRRARGRRRASEERPAVRAVRDGRIVDGRIRHPLQLCGLPAVAAAVLA
ncbi:hypothetical protein D3C71_1439510 [compost metagenome]